MVERARSEVAKMESTNRPAPSTAAPSRSARASGPSPADALSLQRTIGNRAATRMLARWAPHPDKDKKGQFMTDEMATDWNRFNPPLSK